MELAIAGFRQLEETAVAPFSATLEALHADDGLTGLAVLLTGFHAELMRSMPASRLAEIPAFRWGDLWSAAMIRTQQLPPTVGFRSVSGSFVPFGLDVRSHENFVLASLYGVFEDGQTTTVRIPFTGFKVGVIAGAEVWDLFGECVEPVLAALAEDRMSEISGAELREDGDLVLRSPPDARGCGGSLRMGCEGDVDDRSAGHRRHPVHIAEVVRLEGGHRLPLAEERQWAGALLLSSIADAADLIALLRFDRGGWRYQPLSVRKRGGFVMAGEDLTAARRKLKHRTVEILKERASRLLRKS